MSGAGADGAGGLPRGLQRDGNGLAARAAEPLLVGVGSNRSSGHDGGEVEFAGDDEGATLEAGEHLDPTASTEETGRHLHAVSLHRGLSR